MTISARDIRTLLSQERHAAIGKYLVQNGIARYRWYYRGRERTPRFMAPAAVMIMDFESYRNEAIEIPENPWSMSGDVPHIAVERPGKQREDHPGSFINELLAAGEERVFFDDYRGPLAPEDCAAVARTGTFTSSALFQELMKADYLTPRGIITAKKLREMNHNGLAILNWKKLGINDAASIEFSQKQVIKVFNATACKEHAESRRFSIPAGLFNYDDHAVNFQRHLGRGEHVVYFNLRAGNRYGAFTPYSFIDVVADAALSRAVFLELQGKGIIDGQGRLSSAEAYRELGYLECLQGDGDLRSVKDLLRVARPLTPDDLRRDLAAHRTAIAADLRAQREGVPALAAWGEDGPERYIETLAGEDLQRFMANYQRAVIAREVDEDIVKKRGIVLRDKRGTALLLLTDTVAQSSSCYGQLLDFFSRALEGPAEIRIAYAYCSPTERHRHELLHPAVRAFLDDLRRTGAGLALSPGEG